MIEGHTPKPLEVFKTDIRPEVIAIQYLQHEFRKLFPNQEPNFYSAIDNFVNSFPQTLGDKDLWQLLSGISEGYKLKWIYRILTDSQYSWSLERIKLEDITMTGMGSQIDPILKAADWNPTRFPEIWRAHPQHLTLEAQGIKARPQTDHFPVNSHMECGKLMCGLTQCCV